MTTIEPNRAGRNPAIVLLDGDEREILRELVDVEAATVVAGVLAACTPDELQAAIVEVQHRSRLMSAVDDGIIRLDGRTVGMIREGRDETLAALEDDRRMLARIREGAMDHRMHRFEMTRADAEQNVLGHIDRMLDELAIYDRLLGADAPPHP
jgi:hypothetical protein